MPTADRSLPRLHEAPDGTRYRDLNGNGRMDPYEDPRRSPEERAEDLLGRLSLEEKVGLMFHTVIETGPEGTLLEGPGAISKSGTEQVVLGKHMNHFNIHGLASAQDAARWQNRLQQLAEQAPHGIPVTISTDPRHGGAQNAGTSWATSFFSLWPEPLGLGALDDEELVRDWARTVRREYTAVGIRAGLHPVADLATEPRWARQRECFGQEPELVSRLVAAALDGLHGGQDEPAVQTTIKHFPGAGPQKDGEDAHFPYGRDQVYPGGRFEDHLLPFRTAIAQGTDAIMPYYGRPLGLEIDGEAIEEVGFGVNRQILTGLLREELGFDGVIVSDWELGCDNHVGDQVLPARAWGVEELTPHQRIQRILEAGADQFGGKECTELMLDLVRDGSVSAGTGRRPAAWWSCTTTAGCSRSGAPGSACGSTPRDCPTRSSRRWGSRSRIPRRPTSRCCGSAHPSSRAMTCSSRPGSTRAISSTRPGSRTGFRGSGRPAR